MLGLADGSATATSFVEFMLQAIRAALEEAVASDQVIDHVRDQVIRLIGILGKKEAGASELMGSLGLSHRPTFRKNYLEPALAAALIERTQPDSPRSPTQRYDRGGRTLMSAQSRDISWKGVKVTGSPLPNIWVASTNDLRIENNTCAPTAPAQASGRRRNPAQLQAIRTENCTGCTISGNQVDAIIR